MLSKAQREEVLSGGHVVLAYGNPLATARSLTRSGQRITLLCSQFPDESALGDVHAVSIRRLLEDTPIDKAVEVGVQHAVRQYRDVIVSEFVPSEKTRARLCRLRVGLVAFVP